MEEGGFLPKGASLLVGVTQYPSYSKDVQGYFDSLSFFK